MRRSPPSFLLNQMISILDDDQCHEPDKEGATGSLIRLEKSIL